ncbi:hypothetical protein DUI87_34129 [Hirundo rustica rustica]|uniref:Integrase catalytic domain-containing protein n=1 Tax=Hirundo rustica rustica TaxID=333673 RepID=A0A3M0IJA1_HIRRU|nr:hypothetical protein DUI87_34129 [Hirundo rustica rustica]
MSNWNCTGKSSHRQEFGAEPKALCTVGPVAAVLCSPSSVSSTTVLGSARQESTADPEIQVPAAILLVRILRLSEAACSVTPAQEHLDAHIPKSRANEEHRNNEQVDRAAKIEVSKIDLDWEHKGELFLARWAHDASGHQGRDATYKWARDRGVDLTMDSISQVIHDCETCAAIKQAKRVKPLWYGGRWSKYKYGEAWQIDYITLPQTRQGKRYLLTMVEATTGWLETYPVPHATAWNTILGLEKQVLWRHGTPERVESDNRTHFKNSLINTWAREHGIEWVYHIPYHAPAAGKAERHNALLKTQLKALGGGSFKN